MNFESPLKPEDRWLMERPTHLHVRCSAHWHNPHQAWSWFLGRDGFTGKCKERERESNRSGDMDKRGIGLWEQD